MEQTKEKDLCLKKGVDDYACEALLNNPAFGIKEKKGKAASPPTAKKPGLP